MGEDITRAQFFKQALGLAGRYVSEAIEGKLERFLPDGPTPPWALETAGFLATCEKCGACGEICPKGIIYYHKKGDNKIFGGTPYLDFKGSYCDFCGECVKVCPSGALNFEGGTKDIGKVKLSKDLCLVASENCSDNCVGSCPERAILYDLVSHGGIPKIDGDICNGCGACISSCTGSAISLIKA